MLRNILKIPLYKLFINCIYIILIFSYSCKSDLKSKATNTDLGNAPSLVDTSHAKMGVFHKEYFSNGIIEAKIKYNIYTKTDGNVEKIFVSSGTCLTKNSLICKLSNPDLENRILIKTQEYEKTLIDLEDILLGWNYHIKDSLKIPKQLWNTAIVRSGSRLKKTELAILKTQKQKLTIKAPFNGIVSNIKIKAGQPLNSNELICTVSDMSKLIVKFDMIEDDYYNIHKGLSVYVTSYSTKETFKGEIININPQINENGLFTVCAEINNPKLKLVDGMKVKIKILGESKQALLVPKEAIVKRNNDNIIFTYEQNKAVWNFVTIDDENSSVVAISESLKPGDIVITEGNLFLNHNSPVQIISR